MHPGNALRQSKTLATMGQNVNEANPCSLLKRTRDMLRDRPRHVTLRKISDDTGLSYPFLAHMSVNAMDDPGVNKIQTLYEYLSGRKLDVA
jgi:hypothetical protein